MPDNDKCPDFLTFAKRWHRRLPLHFNSRCLGLLGGDTPSANPFSRPSGYPYTTSAYLLIFSHPHEVVNSLATSPNPKHHSVVPFLRTSHVDAPPLYSVSSSTIDAINLWSSVFSADHSTRPSLPRYSVSVAVTPAFTHRFHNGGVAKLISTTHAIAFAIPFTF